jgi:hypothetical protein
MQHQIVAVGIGEERDPAVPGAHRLASERDTLGFQSGAGGVDIVDPEGAMAVALGREPADALRRPDAEARFACPDLKPGTVVRSQPERLDVESARPLGVLRRDRDEVEPADNRSSVRGPRSRKADDLKRDTRTSQPLERSARARALRERWCSRSVAREPCGRPRHAYATLPLREALLRLVPASCDADLRGSSARGLQLCASGDRLLWRGRCFTVSRSSAAPTASGDWRRDAAIGCQPALLPDWWTRGPGVVRTGVRPVTGGGWAGAA